MKAAKSISWWLAILGSWEFLAPFILGYSNTQTATLNAIIIGLIITGLSIWGAFAKDERTLKVLSWINASFGLWLVISPFLLGYAAELAALTNDIFVGLAAIVLGAWAAYKVGGGSGISQRGHHRSHAV